MTDKHIGHVSRNGEGTVSRESAPRLENLDSAETAASSGRASCFLTISQTFSTVSGLAAQEIRNRRGPGCIRTDEKLFLWLEKDTNFGPESPWTACTHQPVMIITLIWTYINPNKMCNGKNMKICCTVHFLERKKQHQSPLSQIKPIIL